MTDIDHYATARAADALVTGAAARCDHHNRNVGMAGASGPMCCYDCYVAAKPLLNAARAAWKAARKAQLDAMPRCELCSRRGTMKVGIAKVLLCGRHFKRAQHNFPAAPFWMPGPATTREYVLKLATRA